MSNLSNGVPPVEESRCWTEVLVGPVRADVRVVRARVRWALDGCASGYDLGDVELMVSEVATNAVRHTVSGGAGGVVWVSVLVSPGRLRVEIRDEGGAEGCPEIPVRRAEWSECGRGLMVVDALADRWETLRDERGRHTVWFEVVR